jgi:hypothetical protein
MPTEKEILKLIERGDISLPPLSFRLIEVQPRMRDNFSADALIEVTWRDFRTRFIVELKSISTPKAFQSALNNLKILISEENLGLMLIMPYLNDGQLQELEREGVSGIDLCGNGIVVVPGKFAVYRTGGRNRFPSSAPIKNIYRKNSSMVGRVFLARTGYNSVQDVWEEVNKLDLLANRWDKKSMSISTVSKSLKALYEDLIIERNDFIRLLQPDKLLEKLSENYLPPDYGKRIRVKLAEKTDSIVQLLGDISQNAGIPIVATGTTTVTQYAVMQRADMLSVYSPNIENILEFIPGSESDRFPDLELIETEDQRVYFDSRLQQNFRWASPVQVYLELMRGDKRDRETAEQVKSYILDNLDRET